MTWMLLVFALHADTNHFSTEVKLPPASSSPAPAPRYEDVTFSKNHNVPIDILYRLPKTDADRIATQIRTDTRIHFYHDPVVT